MTTDIHCSSVCTLCGGRYRWEQTTGRGLAPVHLDGPCEPQTPAEVARIMADPTTRSGSTGTTGTTSTRCTTSTG